MRMSTEEYHVHENNYDGLCLSCGEITRGETVPDAEDYPCPQCCNNTVVGMMTALFDGLIDIQE
jgi:predicted RNA-binding Zn-ribbon protein involved in translation (DUF1610 family)